jgi:hypothetical protein
LNAAHKEATLNQRVPGSSPGAPTIDISVLDGVPVRRKFWGKQRVSLKF